MWELVLGAAIAFAGTDFRWETHWESDGVGGQVLVIPLRVGAAPPDPPQSLSDDEPGYEESEGTSLAPPWYSVAPFGVRDYKIPNGPNGEPVLSVTIYRTILVTTTSGKVIDRISGLIVMPLATWLSLYGDITENDIWDITHLGCLQDTIMWCPDPA